MSTTREAEDAAARVALDDPEDRLARILDFARCDTGQVLRARYTPEERQKTVALAHKNRRQAARLLIGSRAPEWLEELVARPGGLRLLTGPDAPLLKVATRTSFGDGRAIALSQVAAYLVERKVQNLIALTLLGTWAEHYTAPVPHDMEIVQVLANVLDARRS